LSLPESSETAPLLPDVFARWFAGRGWAPRAHQLALLEHARAGRSTLLIAPTGGGQTVFNTSIQYIETGIKVEVEPQIHPDGDVAIKLALEVSQAGAQIDTGDKGTVVFPVNTNNVNTLLQLKDGETQILGGLIQHQMDQSQASLPGVGDLPLVGRLFGTVRDTWNKRELVLAITPRVLRNVPVQESDLIELWSGTEAKVRFGAPALSSGVTGGGVTQAQGEVPAAAAEPLPEAPAAAVAAPSMPPAPSTTAKGTP
jgi:general secretion pathway protein D